MNLKKSAKPLAIALLLCSGLFYLGISLLHIGLALDDSDSPLSGFGYLFYLLIFCLFLLNAISAFFIWRKKQKARSFILVSVSITMVLVPLVLYFLNVEESELYNHYTLGFVVLMVSGAMVLFYLLSKKMQFTLRGVLKWI